MRSSASGGEAQLDGRTGPELAALLQLPRVELFESVSSTLDVVHARAAELPTGTLVVADEQTAGRGRHGRRWVSAPRAGVWLTLLERPTDARALDVLALRCGLYSAEALDVLAPEPIAVKWPNDLYLGPRKLAGVLIETRWRGTAPDWVAIGFGLNLATPALDDGAGLSPGVSRLTALMHLVPALRRAAAASRHLTRDELARWEQRDAAAGRLLASPASGRAGGISESGELIVVGSNEQTTRHRTGTLTFAESVA